VQLEKGFLKRLAQAPSNVEFQTRFRNLPAVGADSQIIQERQRSNANTLLLGNHNL